MVDMSLTQTCQKGLDIGAQTLKFNQNIKQTLKKSLNFKPQSNKSVYCNCIYFIFPFTYDLSSVVVKYKPL